MSEFHLLRTRALLCCAAIMGAVLISGCGGADSRKPGESMPAKRPQSPPQPAHADPVRGSNITSERPSVSETKQGITGLMDAIEACAATHADGAYVNADDDCRDAQAIRHAEPAIARTFSDLSNATNAPEPGSAIVYQDPDASSVAVASAVEVGTTTVYFKWVKQGADSSRSCGFVWATGTSPVTGTTRPSAGSSSSSPCPQGRW